MVVIKHNKIVKARGIDMGAFRDLEGALSGNLLLGHKALSTLIAVWLFMVRSPHGQDS